MISEKGILLYVEVFEVISVVLSGIALDKLSSSGVPFESVLRFILYFY